MPELDLDIAGRTYRLGCGEGEEDRLRQLARRVDAEARALMASMGAVSESRLMLMCALIMADKLTDAESSPTPAVQPVPDEAAIKLDRLAERLEALVAKLGA